MNRNLVAGNCAVARPAFILAGPIAMAAMLLETSNAPSSAKNPRRGIGRREMKLCVSRFLKASVRNVIMPAALGVGIGLGACGQSDSTPIDGAQAGGNYGTGGAMGSGGAVSVYSAPISSGGMTGSGGALGSGGGTLYGGPMPLGGTKGSGGALGSGGGTLYGGPMPLGGTKGSGGALGSGGASGPVDLDGAAVDAPKAPQDAPLSNPLDGGHSLDGANNRG